MNAYCLCRFGYCDSFELFKPSSFLVPRCIIEIIGYSVVANGLCVLHPLLRRPSNVPFTDDLLTYDVSGGALRFMMMTPTPKTHERFLNGPHKRKNSSIVLEKYHTIHCIYSFYCLLVKHTTRESNI